MPLIDRLEYDIREALKGGEKQKLTALRGLKSALKYKQIDLKRDLTDEEILDVLSGAAKKIRDSIEQFGKAGRSDLVEKEEFELKLVCEYLPKPLSDKELSELVQAAIDESGADSPRQMGMVMKILMPKVKGRSDRKQVSRIVSEKLAK